MGGWPEGWGGVRVGRIIMVMVVIVTLSLKLVDRGRGSRMREAVRALPRSLVRGTKG